MMENKIHIVMSTDERQFVGLLATINSLLTNTKTPELVNLHILVPINSKILLKSLFRKYLEKFSFDYKIQEFSPDPFLLENIHVEGKQDYQEKVGSIMNFARFYFSTEFPDLDKVIYLDADLIINGDISKLYKIDLENYHLAGVKIGSFETIGGFNKKSKYLRKTLKINFKDPVFNAGVFVTNLSYWREEDLLSRIKEIMLEHKRKENDGGLYKFATQPVMNLIFNKKFLKIPKKWNFGGLGYMKKIEKEPGFTQARIWHWTGAGKPWEPHGMYKKYWEPYNLLGSKYQEEIQEIEVEIEANPSLSKSIPKTLVKDKKDNDKKVNDRKNKNSKEVKINKEKKMQIKQKRDMPRILHNKNNVRLILVSSNYHRLKNRQSKPKSSVAKMKKIK